jgi:hypothetical protein
MSSIKPSFLEVNFALVQYMFDGLRWEPEELAFGRNPALVPKGQIGIGWECLDNCIMCKSHLSVWERLDCFCSV